ncbi:MAG: CoA transferase [Chloroflexota bacterium]|nr:CoA transferase [Chloroflexota bacterium]
MSELPLKGIRVIDVSVVWAAPYALQLLADYGAEIIKVESLQYIPPTTRSLGFFPPKEMVPILGALGRSFPDLDPGKRPWNRLSAFNCHFRNKHSCTMDLRRPKGKEMFKRLVEISDMVIENNAAGVMDRLGLGYEVLSEWKPDIIMVSSPGFGKSGPYSNYVGFGNSMMALTGFNWIRGYRDSAPETTTTSVWLDSASGPAIAFAAMMALHHRDNTGRGQFIEFAQAENLINHIGDVVLDYTMNGRVQGTPGNRHPYSAAPYGCYRCKPESRKVRPDVFAPNQYADDQWINISVFNEKQWQGLCRVMGNPEWAHDKKFSDVLSRYQNQDELDKHIEEWTSKLDKYEVFHSLQKEGVPAGPVLDDKDAYNDPHLKDRGFFEEVTGPELGTHLYPGMTWKMSKTPGSIRKPPVRLGEDNEYVYKTLLGVSAEEYAELEKEQHIGMDYVGV